MAKVPAAGEPDARLCGPGGRDAARSIGPGCRLGRRWVRVKRGTARCETGECGVGGTQWGHCTEYRVPSTKKKQSSRYGPSRHFSTLHHSISASSSVLNPEPRTLSHVPH